VNSEGRAGDFVRPEKGENWENGLYVALSFSIGTRESGGGVQAVERGAEAFNRMRVRVNASSERYRKVGFA
jgi:hypothetical protein